MQMQDFTLRIIERLKEVNVEFTDIDDSLFETVCKQKTDHIIRLKLRNCKITQKGMELFPSSNWSSLKFLNLENNTIGAKGCKYLSRANMNSLRSLGLSNNNIGSEGVLHLSKSTWRDLQQLHIMGNSMSNSSLKYLMKGNWVKQIEILEDRLVSFDQLKNFVLSEFVIGSDIDSSDDGELWITRSEWEQPFENELEGMQFEGSEFQRIRNNFEQKYPLIKG